MAGYLRRAISAIRTAVARARLEVSPGAQGTLRRLPSVGTAPQLTSAGAEEHTQETSSQDADDTDYSGVGLPGDGADPEYVRKRCSELASRAIRTLLSLVSGDSTSSVGRLGMHAPDAIIGWASADELHLGKEVSFSVTAIVSDPPAEGVTSPGAESPTKQTTKPKRHPACKVKIQPYESLADIKLHLCAAIGADPFSANFHHATGPKIDRSVEGQPMYAAGSALWGVKALHLRAYRAQDKALDPRPVDSLAPALLARWSQAHGVLLEALDAASDAAGREACLPLPAGTVQSIWTILSRCPTEPDTEAKVRQLSATANVSPALRTFERPLLPQNPELSSE